MNETMIRHEIQMLRNRLREIARLDMWELWTYEDEERLRKLEAELEAFKI